MADKFSFCSFRATKFFSLSSNWINNLSFELLSEATSAIGQFRPPSCVRPIERLATEFPKVFPTALHSADLLPHLYLATDRRQSRTWPSDRHVSSRGFAGDYALILNRGSVCDTFLSKRLSVSTLTGYISLNSARPPSPTVKTYDNIKRFQYIHGPNIKIIFYLM